MTPTSNPSFLRRRTASFFCFLSLIVATSVFSAEPAKRRFDLPADTAEKSLKRLAEQSGREVLFPADAVEGVHTKAVKGEMTPQDALDAMLTGTVLIGVQDKKTGSLTVRREKTVELAEKNGASRPASSGAADTKDSVLELDKLEVTGSRIRGLAGAADINPIVTFSRAEIEHAGITSVGELSRLIPQSYSQGSYDGIGFGGQSTGLQNTRDGSIASSVSTSRSTFNLRGLGGANTLVLIDGRRVAKSGIIRGNDAADLAGIPISSIERVDVLLNGASAIYGSDAVGGVINIILRKNYLGSEVALSYENTFESDTAVRTATVTQGLHFGKFRAMISGTLQDRHAFAAVDRPFTATDAWTTLGGTQTLASYSVGGFALGAGVVQATSGTLPGVSPGTEYARIPDGATGAMVPASSYVATTASADLGDRAKYVNLIAPQVNRSGSLRLTYDIAPTHEVFFDGRYSDTKTNIEGMPVNFRGYLSVPANYPGNPFGVPVYLQKTFWELGNLQGSKTAKTSNAALTAGFRGTLPWRDWRYEVTGDWNRAVLNDTNSYSPGLNSTAYNAAIAAQSLVLFYDSRANRPNDLNLLRSLLPRDDQYDRETALTYSASANGSVLDLPAGPLGFAVGAERLEEKAHTWLSTPDSPRVNQSLIGDFKRTNNSAYGEVRVPVLGSKQAIPLVHALDLSAAIRYDKYSDVGGDSSPGFGGTWRPTSWLLFRASRNYSFRAPNLQSLYRPVTSSFVGALPAFGVIVIDRARNNQLLNGFFPASIGGNLALKPEKSISDNFGVVVNVPGTLLKGLSFSIDAQNLDYKDRISTLSFQQIIDLLPERLTRGPNLPTDAAGWPGPITAVDMRATNISKLEVQTIDYQISYQRDTPWGRVDARLALTDYLKYLATPVPGGTPVNTLYQYPTRVSWQTYWTKGALGFGVSGFYQEKQYLNLTYTTPRFRSAVEWNAQFSYDFDRRNNVSTQNDTRLKRWLFAGTKLSLTVNNVFNREPPHVQGNAGFAVTDPRMARYILTVRRTF